MTRVQHHLPRAALVALLLLPGASAHAATLDLEGDPLFPIQNGVVSDVSANGHALLGYVASDVVLWVESVGPQTLGAAYVPGTYHPVLSRDGEWASWVTPGLAAGPTRWHAGVGTEVLDPVADGSIPEAVSSGGVVAGKAGDNNTALTYGARWIAPGVPADVMLGLPGAPYDYAAAHGVSEDGSVVVGGVWQATYQTQAFVWTAQGGIQDIGDLPGGADESVALAISGDGATVFGIGTTDAGTEMFRWTPAGGMESLGPMPGSYVDVEEPAGRAASDGSWVLMDQFIWDAQGGVRSARAYLENELGLDFSGYQYVWLTGASEDRSVLVGLARPNGQNVFVTFVVRTDPPACRDGSDDDGDGLVDFDGGQSVHGACANGVCPPGVSDPDGDGVADPDPQCAGDPWRPREAPRQCGLGAELALLAALLPVLRARRSPRDVGE